MVLENIAKSHANTLRVRRALYDGGVILKFEWEVEPNNNLFPSVRLYEALFKPKDYREKVRHRLEFDSRYLRYFRGNAMLWRIEVSKLSHLEEPKSYAPASAFDNSYPVFIHTNDEDKYDFDSTLSVEEIQNIEHEIKSRKSI